MLIRAVALIEYGMGAALTTYVVTHPGSHFMWGLIGGALLTQGLISSLLLGGDI